MTVATASNKITYAGNGVTTVFPFSFTVPAGQASLIAADLIVTVVNSSGVSTTIANGAGTTQYQLFVNTPAGIDPTPIGGTVTYNPSGIPVPLGSTLTIQRVLPVVQGTSLSNQGNFYPAAVEQALDYITMLIQQLALVNAVIAPASDPAGLNYTLPTAAQRANQALVFDAFGNVTSGVVPSSGIISAPMVPVVGAASLAAGRTAFGLGALATEGFSPNGALQDDGANGARVMFQVTTAAVSRAVTTADYLDKLKVTGPITLTLPRANTLFAGFGFWIENLNPGGVLTIAVNASDNIEGQASGVSFLVPVGWNLFITTNAAASGTWFIELSQGTTVNSTPAGVFSGLSIRVLTGAVGNNTILASATNASVTDGINFFNATPSGTINANSNGLLGLDTGSLAANQEYHVWAIYNPVTKLSSWILSLQSTANATFLAALPAGYTAYARAGTVKTAAAIALHGTLQTGRRVQYLVGTGQTTIIPLIKTGNQTDVTVGPRTGVTVTGPGSVASTLAAAIIMVGSVVSLVSGEILVAPNASYGSATSLTNPPPMQVGGSMPGGSIQNNALAEMLLETNQIFYASNAGAQGSLFCLGWTESVNA